MKDGDRFLRQLEQAKLISEFFFKNTVLYIPDWLYFREYTWANRN